MISNLELLFNYIETGSEKDFESLVKVLSNYLSDRIRTGYAKEYPSWLWSKRKLIWVYERMHKEFPDNLISSQTTERFLGNLFIMLAKTFSSDMTKPRNTKEISFTDYAKHDSILEFEDNNASDDESICNSDVLEKFQAVSSSGVSLSNSAVHFASLRTISFIRTLPMKYRIAILLIHIYPETGMIFNKDESEFIKSASGKDILSIKNTLENLRLNKCKPTTDHIYELRVSDVAELLNMNVNTLSQWLSRGRKQLAKIMVVNNNEK